MTDESERSDGEGGRGMTAGSEGAGGEGPPATGPSRRRGA